MLINIKNGANIKTLKFNSEESFCHMIIYSFLETYKNNKKKHYF